MRLANTFAALLALVPAYSFAGAIPIHAKCEGCTSPQMATKALQLTPNLSMGTSTIHVYSLSTNVLQHFEVECMGSQLGAPPEDETRSLIAKSVAEEEMDTACVGTRVANVIAPDPTVQSDFAKLRAIFVDTGGTMHKGMHLNARDIPNFPSDTGAYEVSDSWQRQTTIGTLLYQYAGSNSGNILMFMFGMAQAGTGYLDGMSVQLTLTYADGTISSFQWTSDDYKFEYIPNSGVPRAVSPFPTQSTTTTTANGKIRPRTVAVTTFVSSFSTLTGSVSRSIAGTAACSPAARLKLARCVASSVSGKAVRSSAGPIRREHVLSGSAGTPSRSSRQESY